MVFFIILGACAFVELLDQVIDCVTDGFKVIVTDKEGLRVLGSLLKMFELSARNVTCRHERDFSFFITPSTCLVVENIDLSRKRFPDMDAIYFVSPSASSVEHIIRDFKDLKRPQYLFIHLFFIQPLSETLIDKLGKSAAIKRVKTFKEFYFDFVCKGLVLLLIFC